MQLPGEKQTDFHDFSSLAVLARAALETYLTMFEVFIQPRTDDEREFQHTCRLLSGFVLREKWVPSSPQVADQLDEVKEDIQRMRSRVKATEVFKRLTNKQKKQVLRQGRVPRLLRERLKDAGFGVTTWSNEYAYQSGHVHADGLSAAQVKSAASRQDQVKLMQPQME